MLIDLFGNISASITIAGHEVRKSSLLSVLVLERVGGALPIMEITLAEESYYFYRIMREMPEVEVSIGPDVTDLTTNIWKVKDFKYSSGKLTISCLLLIPDHTNYGAQWSYSGTLSECLKSLGTVATDVDVSTVDDQIWIRHAAMSDWDFVVDSSMHGWLGGDDFLLISYASDGRLKVSSYNQILGNNDHYLATHNPTGLEEKTILLQDWSFTTNRNIWDAQLVDRSQFTFNLVSRNVDCAGDGKPLPQLLDCGNCHSNYYLGARQYVTNSTKLSYDVIVADFKGHLSDEAAPIMGKVEVRIEDTELSGDYIVLEKSRYYSPSKASTRVFLGRAYDRNG